MTEGPFPELGEQEQPEVYPRPPRWWIPALVVLLTGAFLLAVVPGLLPRREVGSGTGFAIGEGYILTAAHVVRGAQSVTVIWEGRRFKGTVVASTVDLDLALVAVPASVVMIPLILVDADRVKAGDQVTALGFPGGQAWPAAVVTEVVGVGWRAIGSDGVILSGLIAVRALFRPGHSGSPLVDAFGEVVGLVSGTLSADGAGGVGFAVSASRIREWLKLRGLSLPPPQGGNVLLSQSELLLALRRSLVRVEVERRP